MVLIRGPIQLEIAAGNLLDRENNLPGVLLEMTHYLVDYFQNRQRAVLSLDSLDKPTC